MGMRIVDLKQGSPDWVIWRAGGIGASSAAAVLGECKFKTAYDLFLELTNRKPAFEGNAITERGNEMEPAARATYEIDQGFVEAPPVCVLHPQHDFIRASLDGWNADDKIIVEIKCPGESSHQLALNGEVPRHYWIQVQHQLMCVPEAKLAHYWSYRETGKLLKVAPDIEFQKHLLEAEIAFWDLILSDTPPPLTERDAKIVDAPDIMEICNRLVDLKSATGKQAKEESELLKAKVIELGGHSKVRCGSVLISSGLTASGKKSYRMTVKSKGETA